MAISATGRVEITSQNHGFAVDIDSVAGRAEIWHLNLNDKTVEGLRGQVTRSSLSNIIRKPRPVRTTRAICSNVFAGWSKPFRATAPRRSIACWPLKGRWRK